MTIERSRVSSAGVKLEALFGPLTISRLLIAHREAFLLSQVAMAKKLKISSQRLCDFEKGRRLPSPEVAEKWALILKVSTKVWIEAVLKEQVSHCKTISNVSVA